jgi:hypothetical protein
VKEAFDAEGLAVVRMRLEGMCPLPPRDHREDEGEATREEGSKTAHSFWPEGLLFLFRIALALIF